MKTKVWDFDVDLDAKIAKLDRSIEEWTNKKKKVDEGFKHKIKSLKFHRKAIVLQKKAREGLYELYTFLESYKRSRCTEHGVGSSGLNQEAGEGKAKDSGESEEQKKQGDAERLEQGMMQGRVKTDGTSHV